MVVDVVGDVGAHETLFLGLNEVALHLAVEAVAHELKQDIAVAVDTRALALVGEVFEHFVDVGHVEVAADAEVLGTPVVAAQEGVNVLHAALAGSAVAQVTHIQLAGEGQLVEGLGVDLLLFHHLLNLAVCRAEDLSDGVGALGALAEHILVTGLGVELHRRDAGALLSAVVLLLHHQIELAERPFPRTVLLLVIAQWLQQPNQGYAAILMDVSFHCILSYSPLYCVIWYLLMQPA